MKFLASLVLLALAVQGLPLSHLWAATHKPALVESKSTAKAKGAGSVCTRGELMATVKRANQTTEGHLVFEGEKIYTEKDGKKEALGDDCHDLVDMYNHGSGAIGGAERIMCTGPFVDKKDEKVCEGKHDSEPSTCKHSDEDLSGPICMATGKPGKPALLGFSLPNLAPPTLISDPGEGLAMTKEHTCTLTEARAHVDQLLRGEPGDDGCQALTKPVQKLFGSNKKPSVSCFALVVKAGDGNGGEPDFICLALGHDKHKKEKQSEQTAQSEDHDSEALHQMKTKLSKITEWGFTEYSSIPNPEECDSSSPINITSKEKPDWCTGVSKQAKAADDCGLEFKEYVCTKHNWESNELTDASFLQASMRVTEGAPGLAGIMLIGEGEAESSETDVNNEEETAAKCAGECKDDGSCDGEELDIGDCESPQKCCPSSNGPSSDEEDTAATCDGECKADDGSCNTPETQGTGTCDGEKVCCKKEEESFF